MIMNAYRKHVPASVRKSIGNLWKRCKEIALKLKLRPIRVDACLLGGDSGVSPARFARLVGDIRRASRPVSEGPHVRLLRRYDEIGEQLWEPGVFEQTEYYRNAELNIEICGNYHGAVTPDQIHRGARRFVSNYCGSPLQGGQSDEREYWEIAVRPVKDSACYHVLEGHHRLAIAYMKGVRTIPALIMQPPVMTPVQELLLDVLCQDERRELHQPIDSPEVAGWVLLRRCSDRLAKMTQFLHTEGLMPPASSSYLDVACSYGWFVSEMEKVGFRADGVERDPMAISVGQVMYGLKPGQVHRSDCVAFLRALRDRYDVTSCFSIAQHYLLNHLNVSAEELVHLVDLATRRVMFFDMGQCHELREKVDCWNPDHAYHEWPGKLEGWNPDYIHHWLEANTTFTRIIRLGADEDAVPPNQHSFGRMLFACVR
jgi:hypothetical protein